MSTPYQELLDFDVATLSAKLHSREISPVELTEAYLGRIEQTDKSIRAYITVTDTLARKAAKKAEAEIAAGKWRGPFHGVPIALKDLVYTKNILTTGGSKILAEFKPDHDATVWTRLARAGSVLLGKLNLHEFAYGITSSNPHWGIVRNPYGLDRIPGGSSGGSAAAIVAGGPPALPRPLSPLSTAEREAMARSERLLTATAIPDLREALRLARQLADAHPDSKEAQYLAGAAAYRNSRWPEAAAYFRRGGPPGDDHPELLFYMAVAFYEVGDQPGAASALKRSLPNLQKTPFVESYVKRILGQ